MKYLSTFIAVAALIAPAFASQNWSTDLPSALTEAAQNNKVCLVDFNGSDWCPPCIALRKNIFDSAEFLEYAKDKFVLVDIDFPHKTPLSEEQTKVNRELAKTFGVRAYPTVLVLNQDQILIGGFLGGRDLASTRERLDAALANKASIEQKLTEAQKLDGPAKAEMLIQIYNSIDEDIRDNNGVLKSLIIAADPDDTTQFIAKQEEAKRQAEEAKQALAALAKEVRATPVEEREAFIAKKLQSQDCTPALAIFLKQTRIITQLALIETEADAEQFKKQLQAYATGDDPQAASAAKRFSKYGTQSAAELVEHAAKMRPRM